MEEEEEGSGGIPEPGRMRVNRTKSGWRGDGEEGGEGERVSERKKENKNNEPNINTITEILSVEPLE